MRATGSSQRDIAKCYRKLKGVLPSQILNRTSANYAEEASKKLGLPENITVLCKATAENISKLEILTGKKPATIAGVAVWMIVKRSPSLRNNIKSLCQIAEILGMSEAAIKSAYKEVEIVEDDILPVGMQRL